eukprot:303953-Rhodomonas_salina.2
MTCTVGDHAEVSLAIHLLARALSPMSDANISTIFQRACSSVVGPDILTWDVVRAGQRRARGAWGGPGLGPGPLCCRRMLVVGVCGIEGVRAVFVDFVSVCEVWVTRPRVQRLALTVASVRPGVGTAGPRRADVASRRVGSSSPRLRVNVQTSRVKCRYHADRA